MKIFDLFCDDDRDDVCDGDHDFLGDDVIMMFVMMMFVMMIVMMFVMVITIMTSWTNRSFGENLRFVL